ncbi:unnamed protein product [Medioppia subpectinata]|uniref:C2H2-type domain-containing protein n=1 Tax=Medioppia subpectinata TaxID=1979941 RepID=A0A7R9KIG1_9ACAR|nr:unnamed protein product [Medioppia subpectinata]CAG2103847.1 unnamed protein product [Medioppia subpectinata]
MSKTLTINEMDVLREDNQRLTKELSIERQLSDFDGTDSNNTAVNAPTVQLMTRTSADQSLTSGTPSMACKTENGSHLSQVERMADLVVTRLLHTASDHPQCPLQSCTDLGEYIGTEFHYMSELMRRSCGHSVGINCQCLSSPPQQTFSLPVRDITPASVRVERNRRSDTGQRPRMDRSAFGHGFDYWCSWPGCDRAFQTKCALRDHYETTHAANRLPVYACRWPGCDYKTNDKHGLVKHSHGVPEAKSHHKIIVSKTWIPETCHMASDIDGQQLFTPDDISEPNLVIDFNGTQSDDRSADPIVFDRPPLTITGQVTAPATDPKVYQCLECPKSLPTRRGLEIHNGLRHRKTRNGRLKRYRCLRVDCRRRFVSLDKLRDHAVSVHQRRRYPCPYDRCGRSYATTDGLRVHTIVCHRKPSARTIGSDLLDTDFGPNNTANSGRHISHDKLISAKTRSPEECLSPSDMCAQQLATNDDDDSDDTIEPNLVIDLNGSLSDEQSADQQVFSCNDGHKVADQLKIRLNRHEEDTPPLTMTGDSFHRKPVDQLHASGDQQSVAQMAGHITAGFVKDLTPIPAVHNGSQSNYNGTKKRSLMNGTNETQVVDNETTQEIIDLLDSDNDCIEDTTNISSTAQSVLFSIVCPVNACGKRYPNKNSFKNHVMAAHPGINVPMTARVKPYPCPRMDCLKSYQSVQSLQQHIQIYHRLSTAPATTTITTPAPKPSPQLKPYPCPHDGCGKGFESKQYLTVHVMRAHSMATDAIKTNSDTIEPNLVIDLNDTQSVGKGFDPIVAAIRSRAATGVVQVIDIKKPVTDTATLDGIQCPDCGKDFSNKHAMRLHYKYKHSPIGRQRVYACHWPGCHYKTNVKSNLKVHQLVHSEDRHYPCEWPGCEFRGKLKSNLNVHQLVHTDDRPYACKWSGCDYRGKPVEYINDLWFRCRVSHVEPVIHRLWCLFFAAILYTEE